MGLDRERNTITEMKERYSTCLMRIYVLDFTNVVFTTLANTHTHTHTQDETLTG